MPRTPFALDEPSWHSSAERDSYHEDLHPVRTSDDEYEVVDYRPSDESGSTSPIPDQPPRLPSLSESSSATASSHVSAKPLQETADGSEKATATINVSPVSRQALAQRLAGIARQLATTSADELPFDDLSVMEQVNQLELTILNISSVEPPELPASSTLSGLASTDHIPARFRPRGRGDSISQEAITTSAIQLSADLETLHRNLRARQEEATHIQALLLSRLELAAQRILFLQSHTASLESQLQDCDDEVSHLRVLLKALEIQVPEHPDEDMRRCLDRVRTEFWAVRKRRQAVRRHDGQLSKVG